MKTDSFTLVAIALCVIQFIFVVLKVLMIIDWSWWITFIPVYLLVVSFVAGFISMYILSKQIDR